MTVRACAFAGIGYLLAYVAGFLGLVPLPRVQVLPGGPAQGWYALVAFALLCGGVTAALSSLGRRRGEDGSAAASWATLVVFGAAAAVVVARCGAEWIW